MEYLSARLYNSSIIAGGSNDNKLKNIVDEREAFFKVLEDWVHAVDLYLLDDLPESPGEILYGFLFLPYDGLQRANVPFLPH